MAATDVNDSLGMSESAVRLRREDELAHAMKTESGVPTIHALAHSIARIIAENRHTAGPQLAGAGLELET
jgi:hypothetical protein